MRKTYIIVTLLLLAFAPSVRAQVNQEKTVTVTNANGREEQIDLPTSMTQELDSTTQIYKAKNFLSHDPNCNMPDVNRTYSADVYKQRLRKLPTIIEMPYNDIVQKFIDRYTGELRHSVAYMLGAQNFYIPVFEEALEAYDLPLELKYLPVIESALNPQAVSRVGAVGLWQFMITTAKRNDLTVNSLVDERRDLYKASYAAAHYLSDLYKKLGDWNLVIAAYNCGADKINKAIRRSHGERDYWKIYPRLPKETRGYVPAFIAANYIMNYYCDHNICPLKTTLPEKTDTVMVNRDVHFEQIAHVLGMDIDEIRDLNPQYRRDIVNGNSGQATLRLPEAMINKFIDNEDSVYAYAPTDYQPKRTEVEAEGGHYVVNKNQVSLVSRSSSKKKAEDSKAEDTEATATNSQDDSTSSKEVEQKTVDESDNDDTNESGQSKRSSRKRSSRSRKSQGSSSKSKGSKKSKKQKSKDKGQQSKSVTVKSGDTLSEIAERNHTTVKKLRKLNGISGSTIQKGKKIKVK